MKKYRFLAAVLSISIMLSGCASLLNRDFTSITPHNTTPAADGGDPSIIRAENYQGLVNALVYFVSSGMEEGSIHIYNTWDSMESDLETACLEVVQEDPLGAYSVDHIKCALSPVVTYYEADISINYRRTREQVTSIATATGTTAIRSELQQALSSFALERVLRISYFDGDEDYIRTLCREAYLTTPGTALDMPELTISVYPETGRQRIVEIILTYHLDKQELTRRQEELALAQEQLLSTLTATQINAQLLETAHTLLSRCKYLSDGGSTAYHALTEGTADTLGLSLAMALLCQKRGLEYEIVEGTLNDLPHCWIAVFSESGWRHLDLTHFTNTEDSFRTDQELDALGYSWNRDTAPICGPSHDD